MAEKQTRELLAGWSAAAAALVIFAWLARQVLRGSTIAFDATVRDAVHALASPRLTILMRGITWPGSPTVLVSLSIVLVWRLLVQGRKRAARILVIAVLGAELLDELLKLVFHRVRPEAFFGYPEPFTYSFPSGHSVTSCCFYGVVAAITARRLNSPRARAVVWTAASLLVAAIGTSRIYLGVHYPSDVLAGYATAVVWLAAVLHGYHRWMRPVTVDSKPSIR